MPRSVRSVLKALRVAVLGSLLGVALLCYFWSQHADPRFYYLLTSPAGRWVAELCHWRIPFMRLSHEEVAWEEMTEAERRTYRALERELRDAAPSHHLLLKNGRSMLGRILEEAPRYVRFQETFGNSGSLSAMIRRHRILQLEPIAEPRIDISYRDVRFKMEYPEMNLYKRPPYTIVSDEKYFHVENAVRLLRGLQEEFVETFNPLIERDRARDNIQVLFFSNEAAFRECQQRYAPRMESSVGFYSPWADRFVVFNQRNSEQMYEFGRLLDAQARRYLANERMYGGVSRIRHWKEEAGRRMAGLAEEQTRATIRHEGAHQLLFTYGIHSEHRIENEWLYEGLAVYCETPELGRTSPYRVALLKAALAEDRLIPLPQLVNHRSRSGLFEFGAEEEAELAYTQSGMLVHFLMQPAYREAFFDYIRFIRGRQNFSAVLRQSRHELLCRMLDVEPEAFSRAWQTRIKTW